MEARKSNDSLLVKKQSFMGFEKAPVIIALDGMEKEAAVSLAAKVSGRVWGFKVHDLFDTYGPEIISLLKPFGKVFVDMKLNDIPQTMYNRTKAQIDNGADLVTVHASAGMEALEAAAKAGGEKVVAVTKLTSEPASVEQVVARAEIAYSAGIRNIVCSAHEAHAVRSAVAKDVNIITPGIRLADSKTHDQQRVATPEYALEQGADLLVVGRSITQAEDPVKVLEEIRSSNS